MLFVTTLTLNIFLEAPQPRLSDVWTPCIEFCQSENQTQIPTCFDPTLNTNIDISLCEIESLNLRTCPKQDFPCPSTTNIRFLMIFMIFKCNFLKYNLIIVIKLDINLNRKENFYKDYEKMK